MGIFEKNAGGSQTVQIRGKGLRVTTHAADPIVQIVDCDKKDIGLGSPKTLGQQTHREMELRMNFSQKKRKGKSENRLIFAIIGQKQGKGRNLVFPSSKDQVKPFLFRNTNENP